MLLGTAGAVVLVARHGKVAALETIGKMNTATGAAMRPDAVFRIYSMSKPITSVAVLMLFEEGKLKLDDPVSAYLPEFKNRQLLIPGATSLDQTVPVKTKMTIHHLLTHTSGLPAFKEYWRTSKSKPYTLSKIFAEPLEYQPGTKEVYSDLGIILMAEIVADHSRHVGGCRRGLEKGQHTLGDQGEEEETDPSHQRNHARVHRLSPPGRKGSQPVWRRPCGLKADRPV